MNYNFNAYLFDFLLYPFTCIYKSFHPKELPDHCLRDRLDNKHFAMEIQHVRDEAS